jgi:RNA polymerase sigma-70 factor (ECF subfamily)
MSIDEPHLIQRLQAGDKRAFKELVEKTQDNIYNTCFSFVKNKQDAEDIAQQVYIEVLRNVQKFRGDAKLSTWMYRIAVNRSLNLLHSQKRHQKVQSLDEMMASEHIRELPVIEESTDEHEEQNKRKMAVLEMAIQDLPENQRIALNLNKFENLPYQEVAEIMGISLSAVTALINRAKVNLQKKVKILYKKNEMDAQGF